MKKIIPLLLTAVTILTACAVSGAPTAPEVTEEPETVAVPTQTPDIAPTGKAPEDYTGALTVYAAVDPDARLAAVAGFEALYPNVTVTVVPDSAARLVRNIVREADAPVADVLWGVSADTLPARREYFRPSLPDCLDLIDPSLCDAKYCWIGEEALPTVFIANTDLIPEEDIPRTWAALADFDADTYGRIAVADPAGDRTAFAQLCAVLFLYGEAGDGYASGWELVRAIAPKLEIKAEPALAHADVAAGVNAVGITLEPAAMEYARENLTVVYPQDGTSAVPSCVAVVKDCPDPELADLFVEYLLSTDCQTAQSADWGRRPVRSDVVPANLPPLDAIPLVSYDYDYAAANVDAIREQWLALPKK